MVKSGTEALGSDVRGTRTIKKYPNRRLYDTAVSRYITLEDVRRLVLNHVDFAVLDAKTSEDITRSILLQIILEQEEGGEPIFSTDVLQQVIRFYGDTLQGMIATYLDKSLKLFVEQQHMLREQVQNVVTGDPMSLARDLTEQNIKLWKEIQDRFFGQKAMGQRKRGTKKSNPEETESAGPRR